MGAGKVLALIGAIVGLVSVALSFVLPAFFGWFRIEGAVGGITVIGFYITGLGTFAVTGFPGFPGIAIFELIGGIVLIIGAIVCIIGAVKESKVAGIVGGILILVAPILLLLDLLIGMSGFSILIETLGGPPGASVLWGSFVPAPGVLLSWGIWIGTFVALGGGVLGLIGGATL